MSRKIFLQPGERAHVELPFSEVCMHLRVAGRILPVEMVADNARPLSWMVQIYDGDDKKLSFPITPGEAGFHFSDFVGGWYCYGDYAMNAPSDIVDERRMKMARYECRDQNGVTFATSDDWGLAMSAFRDWSGMRWNAFRRVFDFDPSLNGAGVWDNDDQSFQFQLVADNDEDYDPRPFGELQEQVNFLEYRYDDGSDF